MTKRNRIPSKKVIENNERQEEKQKQSNKKSRNTNQFYCPHHKTFLPYRSAQAFIKGHVMKDLQCQSHFISCDICNQFFYTEEDLGRHWKNQRKGTNNQCRTHYEARQRNENFTTSQMQCFDCKIPFNEIGWYGVTPVNYFEQKREPNDTKVDPLSIPHLSTMKHNRSNVSNNKEMIDSKPCHGGIVIYDPIKVQEALLFQNALRQHQVPPKSTKCVQQTYQKTIYGGAKKISSHSNPQSKQQDHNNLSTCKSEEENLSMSLDDNSIIQHTQIAHSFSDEELSEQQELLLPSDHHSNISDDDINIVNLLVEPSDQSHISNESHISISSAEDLYDDNSSLDSADNNNNDDEVVEIANIETVLNDNDNEQLVDFNSNEHFMNMKSLHESERNTICDDAYYESLKLIHLLMESNLSLKKFYPKYQNFYHKDDRNFYSFDKVVKLCEYRVFGESLTKKMQPKRTNLVTPSGQTISVISFDIDGIIYDLLSDSSLTQIENTIFKDGNEENPFYVPLNIENYGDIDQSDYYVETIKKLNLGDQSTDVLVPLQIYMDATTLDNYAKLLLHPIVITLLIYNRTTRNLSMTWRTLGYIPNFNEIYKKSRLSTEQKDGDFHFCLRYLLSGIKKLQSREEGYKWTFKFDKYGNTTYERNLHFKIANVLGDAEGLDKLCSRYGNRMNSERLARDCNVKTQDSDNPDHACIFHMRSNILNMTDDELRAYCFRRMKNAFDDLDFGANIYGINGASCADPCHQINKGIIERLPAIFLSRLSTQSRSYLNAHIASLCSHLANQSDRTVPNIKRFKKGYCSSAKLRSDENIARVFIIYLVLLTPAFEDEVVGQKGRKLDKNTPATRITLEEYNKWINVFEETLIFHSWVYMDDHPKAFFKGGRHSVVAERLRTYMKCVKDNAPRKEGMGLRILKFHQILHLWWIVRLFGSLYNVDTARTESHHRKKKKIGKHTQQRSELFDEQTAYGEYRFDLLLRAMILVDINISDIFEHKFSKKGSSETDENSPIMNKANRGSKFTVTFDYTKKTVCCKWISKKPNKNKTTAFFYPNVCKSLFNKFENYNHGKVGYRIKSIKGFTEFRLPECTEKSCLLRAYPSYRKENDWFDWAYVKWDGYDEHLACQCLMFLDFTTVELEKSPNINNIGVVEDPHTIIHNSHMAVLHCVTGEQSKSTTSRDSNAEARDINTDPIVSNRLTSFHDMEPSFQIVSMKHLVSTAFVIPYEFKSEAEKYIPGCATKVMCLTKKENWNSFFVNYKDPDLKEEALLRNDDLIDNDNNRYPFEG